MPEPERVQRHADHGPEVTCRPAGNGLCEPVTALSGQEWRDAASHAIADVHRHQRQHRTGRRPQEITGYVKPPEQLPLDTP